ncbi:MAG: CHASE2 domain-containing protein [Chitinivibrionales bacterium]|nr:CHASE2 domain-containing protein [Chitinivibrionales bacterium]
MEPLKKIGKSLLIGGIVGLAMTIVTSYFLSDLIDQLEYQTYYWRYKWEYKELGEQNKEKTADDEYGICIVDIDDRSMAEDKLGLYWNWDRSYHANLITTLNKKFPAAIVFDIFFGGAEDHNHAKRLQKLLVRAQEKNEDIEITQEVARSMYSVVDYDKQFIEATRDAGNVFHACVMTGKMDYKDYALSQIESKMTMERHNSLHPSSAITLPGKKREEVVSREVIEGIFPPLAQASKDIGHVNINPNVDGVKSITPLLFGFGDHDPVYLPISVRTIATLFGTPNDEIIFEPGKYLDIGKPFKITRKKEGGYHCSYPNVTIKQVKAIVDNADKILALEPENSLQITSLLKRGKTDQGDRFIEMNLLYYIPEELLQVLLNADLKEVLTLKPGEEKSLGSDVAVVRDSDVDWIITAPFGDMEWYTSTDEIKTLATVEPEDFDQIANGETALLYHTLNIFKNKEGKYSSSVPIFRGPMLKELCRTEWKTIEELAPGSRMDFGKNVRIPLTPDNKHIITFFGPKRKPFKYYSYYDILNDRVHGELEGKIFIVGSTAPAMFDLVHVPHDEQYPGMEIHASMMNSFLMNTFITRPEDWQNFLILLCVGIAIGIISFVLKPLPGAILTIVAVFAYFLTALTLFGTNHLWIDIARPVLTILLTFTAVMAYRYITEEKDRKFLQSTFKQYLSPELIDIMYKKKKMPELGGEEGVRTAYFTDIQSFSTFSEKLGSPTRLVELLNEYLSAMTDILLAHYGTLDKYEGDAIIAFYGAPMPMDDHAHQACYTALDMQDKLGELRNKWISEGDKWPKIVHEMQMRIGVNTGAITTGNMGSKVRMNYTMMGDAVNLAARLEAAAKQYGIYTMISHYTHDLIKDDFETRQLDKITVVGKSEPIVVYELMARKGELSPEMSKLHEFYTQGIDCYYRQEWDKAIDFLSQSEDLEPYKAVSSKGGSPSNMLIKRCKEFKANPPGTDWDGVYRLTSK